MYHADALLAWLGVTRTEPVDAPYPLGRYTVTLDAGGAKRTQPAEIVKTQGWPIGDTGTTIRQR